MENVSSVMTQLLKVQTRMTRLLEKLAALDTEDAKQTHDPNFRVLKERVTHTNYALRFEVFML